MNHLEILDEILARGLSVVASGADLKLQGPRERMDTELVDRIRAVKPELIAHLAREAGFGLTPLQRSYLAGRDEAFELGNIASYVYHEIEGSWDLEALESALRTVVARHSMLRTRFTEQYTQIPESAVDVGIGQVDLRGLPAEEQHRRRAQLREQWSHRMLPVDSPPLMAVEVTLLADDRMVLHVGHDGLVMDGISMFLFFLAWWGHYTGDREPAGEEASFESYVAALDLARTRKPAERSKAYWLDRLDGLAGHPDLPLATSPSAITHPRVSPRTVRVAAPEWAALKERAARDGVTPSGLLLAAYAETLCCWGAGTRFTLNTTVANRPPIHPRILDAIGPFSDPMLVEVDLDRRLPFAARARVLQERLRSDLDHRHFSGIEVMRELALRRGGSAGARMPFTFNSAIGYSVSGVDGSALELFGPEVYTLSQTPQVWLNVFAMEQHGSAVVQIDGVDELFPAGLLDDLAQGYQNLLDQLADESAWQARLFDLLPRAQRERRIAANDTAVPLPETLLQQPFMAQAQRSPDAPAVITSRGEMSYAELHRRASVAAGWLRAEGVGRDELVGLVMTRGPEQIVGIMATVMAGAAYLPIDATLPEQRQEVLLNDGGVRCVLTNTSWSDPDGLRQVLRLDGTDELLAAPVVVPIAGAHPDDLAYVLYTSGTTGAPKGVMVSHRNVANVVADCTDRFGVGPGDRLFAISAFNFDLSVYDVFGALSAGAAIVLPDHDRAADPAHWLRMCERGKVSVWNSVPQIVALLHDQAVAEGPSALADLRLVMMSGDRIPPQLPSELRRTLPGVAVISLGGPTETTIWNIVHPVGEHDDGRRSIPYGRPNSNNKAYVLDADGLDAPDWVVGEICASGTGLARGYWGDDVRTAERFFIDERRGERLYRTGDLGRYLPDGEIMILGRRDYQIKVNGYRIEAGEVETRLRTVPGVRQAVVVRQEGPRGDRLVAHLVPETDRRPSDGGLRQALREHLPEYMVPSALVWHENLPLTRNGKVDRSKLTASPLPATPAQDQADGAAEPAPGVERELAALWASVLKLSTVDAVTRLADLGGDSLAAARILAGVRKRYGTTISLFQLPDVETVRAMAVRIGVLTAGAQ